MKIIKSVSEKRTYRTMSDEYISREFSAARELELPERLTPEEVRLEELKLLVELRREVLMAFVLEGQISQQDFATQIANYESILQTAMQAAAPEPAHDVDE